MVTMVSVSPILLPRGKTGWLLVLSYIDTDPIYCELIMFNTCGGQSDLKANCSNVGFYLFRPLWQLAQSTYYLSLVSHLLIYNCYNPPLRRNYTAVTIGSPEQILRTIFDTTSKEFGIKSPLTAKELVHALSLIHI